MKNTIWQESKSCKVCKTEYTANITSFINTKGYDLSGGLCPDCRATKLSDYSRKSEALRMQQIQATRKRWKSISGIPLKYQAEDFNTFIVKDGKNNLAKFKQRCLDYANNFPIPYRDYSKSGKAYPSLVLMSYKDESSDECGVGKTHLACSIAHEIINRWNGQGLSPTDYGAGDGLPMNWTVPSNPVVFISEPELYSKIKETYSFTPEEKRLRESETDIINRMVGVDLLILDDVGKDKKADLAFVRRILFAIVNGRYNKLKPIILTTNLDPHQLKEYLTGDSTDASYDRLTEMCSGNQIRIKGKSHRIKETN